MSSCLKTSNSRQPEAAKAGQWSDALQIRSPDSLACPIESFLSKVTERVIESLYATAQNRYSAAAAAVAVKSQEQADRARLPHDERATNREKLTPQQQMERAKFLADLTAEGIPDGLKGDNKPGAAAHANQSTAEGSIPNTHLQATRSIIRGYLIDFLRQTEEQIVPCNIANGRPDTSEQRAYWEKQPSAKFWSAAGSGVFHSVFSYNKLCEIAAGPRSVAWSALANIVKTSAATFKEMHLEAFPGVEPRASVLDDHYKVLQIAARHGPAPRPRLPRAS